MGTETDSRRPFILGASLLFFFMFTSSLARAELFAVSGFSPDTSQLVPIADSDYQADFSQLEGGNSLLAAGARPGSTSEPASGGSVAPAGYASSESGAFTPVAAVLVPRCSPCHSPNGIMDRPPEGFVATSYATLLESSERAWIVPGHPLASELYRRIQGHSLPRMPFNGPPYLTESEIDLIGDWIAAGAPDDNGRPAPLPVGARVRLGGTLGERWQLDGLNLEVAPGARIEEPLPPGQRVEVRGRVGTDGVIAVERIRGR